MITVKNQEAREKFSCKHRRKAGKKNVLLQAKYLVYPYKICIRFAIKLCAKVLTSTIESSSNTYDYKTLMTTKQLTMNNQYSCANVPRLMHML